MALNFNNLPDSVRTPGVYVEIDNSRALKGLYSNPHKALIIGHKNTIATPNIGTKASETLVEVTRESYAEGYFGAGSEIARMIEKFKKNNPNTECYAIALSTGTTTQNYWSINPSGAFAVASLCNGGGTYYLLINGILVSTVLTSAWSKIDVCSAIASVINSMDSLPVTASVHGAGVAKTSHLIITAKNSGETGNYIDIRDARDYYNWISYPSALSTTAVSITNNSIGAGTLSLASAWAIVDNEQFHYIIHSCTDSTNLTSIEGELEDRWEPLEDLPGIGFTSYRATQANLTTLGNGRNSPYHCIFGMYASPSDPAEVAAALGGIAAKYLNDDPARPLHYLELKGILPPLVDSRFTRSERDILLYDGIATYVVDSTGSKVQIERLITTYQKNSTGVLDASYLDVTTLATLSEIRYQVKARLLSRFISPRYKLAGDTYAVQPGSYITTPSAIKSELIALFAELELAGLVEDLSSFKDNIVVERDTGDQTRVNILLPPDLCNGLEILGVKLEFIL